MNTREQIKARLEEIEKKLLPRINDQLILRGSYMSADEYDALADKRDALAKERNELERLKRRS